MKATDILVHEHKVISLVLQAAEKEAASIQQTGKVHADVVGKIVEVLRNFADKCHHGKEEKHLFVMMQKRGMPGDSGPIAVMLHEHVQGRTYIKTIADSLPQAQTGDAKAIETLRAGLLGYAALLRAHIDKENTILFPMADRLLSEQDQTDLIHAFERIEQEEMGAGVHEKYHRWAHELAGK
jgi:hemerythrin-like domain-containing protein